MQLNKIRIEIIIFIKNKFMNLLEFTESIIGKFEKKKIQIDMQTTFKSY